MFNTLSRTELEEVFSDKFLIAENTNPLYSLDSIEFYQEFFGSSWKNYCSVFFVDGRPVAVLLMFVDHEASYFGMPGALICNHSQINSARYADILLGNFISSLRLLNIQNIKLFSNFNLKVDSAKEQYIKNVFVDLSYSEEIIRSKVRKSYKSLLNWGVNNMSITIYNNKNISNIKFKEIQSFHLLAAKKKTRSDKSWDIQYEMIMTGNAFLVEALYKGQLASASIIIHNSIEAFYGVSINEESLMVDKLPINHLVLFRAIIEAKNIGLSKFNFGDTSPSSDVKVNNINNFKNGFARQSEKKLSYNIHL